LRRSLGAIESVTTALPASRATLLQSTFGRFGVFALWTTGSDLLIDDDRVRAVFDQAKCGARTNSIAELFRTMPSRHQRRMLGRLDRSTTLASL
jgi:hypothetical protein